MALFIGGTEIENVYANGQKTDRVFANGVLVYESTIYIEKPTVTGAYTFNTLSQSAIITGYDETQLTLTGTKSAKAAGTYHVYFELKKGYAWKDGTTDKLDLTWEIAKLAVAVPTLTSDSFTWLEGSTHSANVQGMDSTYVTQSGTTSQTDSSANIDTSNTITWALTYPNDTTWADGTAAEKTATWSVKWVDGTSHYKNDFYNRGWNSGLLGYIWSSERYSSVDYGSASKPYITITYPAQSGTGISYESIYVKSAENAFKTHWEFIVASGSSKKYMARIVTKNSIDSGNANRVKCTNSEATLTTSTGGTVYGTTTGDTWTATIYPAFGEEVGTGSSSSVIHITRIYHD